MENLVKYNCKQCDGSIEVEISHLEPGESRGVECPHCHSETTISAPVSKKEKERSDRVSAVNVVLSGMYDLARNHFFGTGVRQSMFESYKWIYAIHMITEGTGIELVLNPADQVEFDSIGSMVVDALTDGQIKNAHEEAGQHIVAIFTDQTSPE